MAKLTTKRAFEVLTDVVRESHERGRRATAARVKALMRYRTHGDFDERLLGFASFRAFLSAAQEQNIIALHSGTYDLFVTPPGTELPAPNPPDVFAASTDLGDAPRRIRAHLWRCFVDWSPGTTRFYDREEDYAFSLPTRPSPRERVEDRSRREALDAEPGRFVAIEPIAFDTQLGWMHRFTEHQPSPIKEQLQLALASTRPARDFTGLVRAAPALSEAWHRDLLREVSQVIEQWALSHSVPVDIYVPTSTPSAGKSNVGSPRPASASALRAALHRAIDRMPEHELMAISLPAGYLVETREQA